MEVLMVWDTLAKKRVQSDSGASGAYMRLADDGDHALVAFLGEPVIHYVLWTGEGYEEYSAAAHGPRASAKPSMRAAIAVYDMLSRSVKVWDMPKSGQTSALAAVKKFSPEKWAFEVTRSGAKGSTDTKYNVLPDHELTPEELLEIRGAQLPDIAALIGIEASEVPAVAPSTSGSFDDSDIPF